MGATLQASVRALHAHLLLPAAKHHPDLIMCRKLPGIAIGRLCEKCTPPGAAPPSLRPGRRLRRRLVRSTHPPVPGLTTRPRPGDGKCVICDSYVRPATLVRVCDECNYGSFAGRCVICGGVGISDAYYCKECTLMEKDVRAPPSCSTRPPSPTARALA